eukprot:424888_1
MAHLHQQSITNLEKSQQVTTNKSAFIYSGEKRFKILVDNLCVYKDKHFENTDPNITFKKDDIIQGTYIDNKIVLFGEPYNVYCNAKYIEPIYINHITSQINQTVSSNISMSISNKIMNDWNLIDFSTLIDPSYCLLPTKQRRELYTKLTKRFRFNKDNSISGDITDNTFAKKLHPIPLWQDIIVTISFYVIILLYLIPVIFIAIFIYLMYCKQYIICIIASIIYLYLTFHQISLWRNVYHNRLFFCFYNYFSYKFVYHSSVKYYVTNHLLNINNDKYCKPLIIIGLPHAIMPFAIMLSPVITKDILNKPTVGCYADILAYIPILRNLLLWAGSIPASKSNIIGAISKGYNIGIVPDGIAGMFTNSDNDENILLKNRKGIAKLALQTGCSIVPVYGFGNTALYKAYFDPFGIMKYVSRKLKMSLIAFSGRFYGLSPKRIPLYCVMGKIINNPNNNIPIGTPSQKQIDEYHNDILSNLTQLF